MEYELKNHRKSKMIKYPKNFRTVFRQRQAEYEAIKEEVDARKFEVIAEKNGELEFANKDFVMRIPRSPKEIADEANELHHCVRTYIPRVLKEQTLIMFLRDKDMVTQPLVTVEVKNGRVTQAYGINDSKPSDEQLEFLRKWAKKKKLKMAFWRR